ncbi:glycosylphosphatidylinositol anchor biosynthesis [Geranomyces michiganensis]|nr:glycosylphosphatidylinositol anchor biosynthesis [Geranomyces michiganensis]
MALAMRRTRSRTLPGLLLVLAVLLLSVHSVAAVGTDPAVPPAAEDLAAFTNTDNVTLALWSEAAAANDEAIEGFFSNSGHTNNWAVLVCTSRFWFNYRHIANTLSIYHTVKRLGIPDSNIILMLSDDVACNARNHFPATVYNNAGRFLDLYGRNIEVDYRGYEVTVENFIRMLTGRHESAVPRSKRLLTDDRSNILVYMTGHGGDEFLKFQDAEEISSYDIADAFGQMHEKKRYHEIFFMIDTCQAASMYKQIYSPNILAAASALKGQNSYSHHLDPEIGVAVIDRFTYYNLETLEKLKSGDPASLADLFASYSRYAIASTPGVRRDLYPRGTETALVTDFFGGVQNIRLTKSGYTLGRTRSPSALELPPPPSPPPLPLPSGADSGDVSKRRHSESKLAGSMRPKSTVRVHPEGRPSLLPFLGGLGALAVVGAVAKWSGVR